MSGDDQEIEVRLTADGTDLKSGMEDAADQVAASNQKLAGSAASASENILQQGADLATLDEIMAGTAKNADQLAAQELALDRLMAAGAISAGEQASALEALTATEAELGIATEATTAATVENAAAQGALNEKIASGAAVREYSALVDEAISGNYRRMSGTVATLGNRLGLLSAVFSPLGAAVATAAAAVITFGTALVKGAEESEAFNEALLKTNGYIGITENDFREMANQLQSSSVSIGTAKDALLAVANTGRYTGDQIRYISQAVLDFSEVTGEKLEKGVAVLSSLQDRPLEAAVKLNEQYHFLTEATYKQIAALEQEGDRQGAAAAAQEAFASILHAEVEKQNADLGTLARSWNSVRDAVSSAWNSMKSIGTTTTLQDQLNAMNSGLTAQQIAVLNKYDSQRAALLVLIENQKLSTAEEAKKAQAAQNYIDIMQGSDKSQHTPVEATPKSAYTAPKPDLMQQLSDATITKQEADNTKLIQDETSTQHTIEEIDAEREQASISIQENALKQKLALGEISKTEELQGLVNLENQKYTMASQAMDQQAALYGKDTQKYNEYLLAKDKLAQQHNATIIALEDQEALAIQTKWQQMLAPVASAFQQSANGIIQGTETTRQAMSKMAMSILDEFIAINAKKVTDWIASEMAQTTATGTATGTRTALTTAAATETKTQAVSSADTAITANAAQAASGSAASVSAIPVVGWAMALEVGAATLAAVLAYKGLASASGGWEDVPGTQLAMLHKNEMVLPAKTAQTVRDAVGGSGGTAPEMHFHMQDTAGLQDMLRRNPRLLADAMVHAARQFGGR